MAGFLLKKLLLEILERHEKHAKTFAVLFAEMFVVHFVGSTHRFSITIVGVPENLEPLVDKYIMNDKISHAVRKNAKPDTDADLKNIKSPQ